MMYLRWRRLLPSWIEVIPVELPGRGALISQDYIENYDALVAFLMREHQKSMDGRFALFGHSMGALLAYGIAKSCVAQDLSLPLKLFTAGCSAPSQRDDEPFIAKGDDAGLIDEMRKQGGTPEAIYENEEMLSLTLNTLGSDYRVCETFAYLPNSPIPIPLHAFAGKQDDTTELKVQSWSLETTAEFTADWFEGGHFFIETSKTQVLEKIRRYLAPPPKGIAT